MKKSLKLLAVFCLLLAQTAFSQNVNLKFKGATTEGRYVKLDSVKVENISRSWVETLVYPDTILSLSTTGIEEVENDMSSWLMAYPNPFQGTTSISLTLLQSEVLTMQVYNLTGQRIIEKSMQVEAGEHHFDIHLDHPQVYFLVVSTAHGKCVQKLINIGSYGDNSILYVGTWSQEIVPAKTQKLLSSKEFHAGDVLKMTGYVTHNGVVVASNEILQPQTESESFTLFFSLQNATLQTLTTTTASNITDTSAVSGGIITNDGGATITARGVCWSTSPNPTISDNYTFDETGIGNFTSNITGLTAGTTYYVRAYATNATGTAYGNEILFITNAIGPTIITATVSNITDSSAVSGGIITSDGGAVVIARGICWDTLPNPTINSNHTSDSSGIGNFTSSITGLIAGTTYYVRAYAVNSVGTAYGNQVAFTTMAMLPTLTTTAVSNITYTSAVCGGNITSDGGYSVTARGVCWSIYPNPTINNNHTTNGSGTGSFTSSITGLLAGTTYYLRAYATNAAGTGYGNEISFTTIGIFSVSATQKVLFSPGNLQWSATNGGNTATTHAVAGNGTAAGTWRFAPNQWDMIGAANSNVSSTYTGWIDLFGWGTSGYNNKYPYMTSTNYADYGNGNNNIAGTNYDWGVYNAIYNPKTQTTDAPGTWRTLTNSEWRYLLNTRTTSSGIRYAKATVCRIVGLIIVPDNWSNTIYTLDSTNTHYATYASNIINTINWTRMEAAGCVFLPAAGYREGISLYEVGSYSWYWSTMWYNSYCAYALYFHSGYLDPSLYASRYYGRSVRLVRSAW